MKRSHDYAYRNVFKRMAVRMLDAVGGAVSSLGRKPAVNLEDQDLGRILVIRLDHLGDVLMTLPALHALHARFPKAQIDLLVSKESSALLDARWPWGIVRRVHDHWFSREFSISRCLAEVRPLIGRLKVLRYDLAIDFRGDLRNILLMKAVGIPRRLGYGITGGGFLLTHSTAFDPNLHQALLNFRLLEPLGISGEVPDPPVPYFTGTRPKEEDDSKRIVIHPGAGFPSKKWPEENFVKLMTRLSEDPKVRVLVIGMAAEKEQFPLPEVLNERVEDLRGIVAIRDLPVVLEACDLFIGNDSGPAHIAAACGTEVLVIFSGTNDVRLWHPWSHRIHLLQHRVPCSPCEAKTCPLAHHDCMRQIQVSEVYERAKAALAREKIPVRREAETFSDQTR